MGEFATDIQLGAHADLSVLISGPCAAGSEAVALMMHGQSRRSRAPLVTMCCAAIPVARQESEFRAHAELARGGTLLLEHVDRIGPALEMCLLDFLRRRPTASSAAPRSIEPRVMATTTRALFECVVAGGFPADLYYRLNTICITVPVMSEVSDDVPLLVDQMLRALSALHGIVPPRVDRSAMAVMQSYDWPGNLRELREVLESLLMSRRGTVINPDHLPAGMSAGSHKKIVTSGWLAAGARRFS
jgi:DNA-binding NtrC family response regulator